MLATITVDRDTDLETPSDESVNLWVKVALENSRFKCKLTPEISIHITGTDEASRLNQSYRGILGPTNVLSFPADLAENLDLNLLGDLVICAPLVINEAKEQGKETEAHWAHLVIHGVLHLLGHDHQVSDEADAMEALEIRTLSALGYGNPYAIDRSLARIDT